MGIFDRLKFKSPGSSSPKKAKEPQENVLDLVKEGATEKKPSQPPKEATGSAFRILLKPGYSEKSTMLTGARKYVFVVANSANKPEVKKAVEKVYDVKVEKVNIVNLSGKARRYGRSTGRTRSRKKAIVTLRTGQKIEGFGQSI
ncbi:MAG: 50S ribosomal protein L23 [Candidatus Doudnabacteria bacterium]|nr:50S ribosomal protein L23 [Candidatus Doudnabacteria bacterium]